MKYKINLQYCIDLINSKKSKNLIRKTLHFLFQFEYNFLIFCKFFLPKAFTKEFQQFHIEVVEDVWDDEDAAFALPRGHGKSTLIGQGFLLHRIAYKLEKYILYSSQNTEKSIQFLEPIKYELKNNKLLNFVYPNIDLRKVKDEDSGRDRSDCFDIGKELRVQAFSYEKNVRGFKFINQRPTLIIFDDIDDDQRVINPILRAKDHDKFIKQMIPCLDAEFGKYKILGTIIHLNSNLAKQIKVLNGKVYKAYELDDEGKIIPESILFPSLFNVKYFEDYIAKWGSLAASSEFLNNPVDDVSSLIKRKWVKSTFCEDLSFTNNQEKYDRKVQGVDFAFSDRITADKSAFVGLGKNENCVDLISLFTKKGMSIIEQFDYIEYLNGTMGFDINGLEENSIRSMSNEIPRYNFKYKLFWMGSSDKAREEKVWKTSEYEEKRHTIGKTAMIKRLATVFETNFNSVQNGEGFTFRVPYMTSRDRELAHQLMDECCSFALQDGKLVETGVHPDIPIGLQIGFELLGMKSKGGVDVAW